MPVHDGNASYISINDSISSLIMDIALQIY